MPELPSRKGKQSSLKRSLKRLRALEWKPDPSVLLHENIPKPLHGVAPRVVLGQKWWNEERKKAYRSTAFHCLACGVPKLHAKGLKHLEGHEAYEIDYRKGRAVYTRTIPLCNWCHSYIHDGRLRALVENGTITHQRFAAIIQHGDEVLSRVGLVRLPAKERADIVEFELKLGNVKWSQWRMVVDGKEYKPKYKNLTEWKKAHAGSGY